MVNPAPLMLTPVMVIDVLPPLVRVTLSVLDPPTATPLKFKPEVLSSSGGVPFTVRTAALLVTLPAELVTVTVN